MLTKRYIIEGHVQGVGFRNFVFCKANDLRITGWTKNLANGNVECLAYGDSNVLKKFEAQLWKGPYLSKVTHIEITEETSQKLLNSFEIIY